MGNASNFSIGVEEEYFLVHAETSDVAIRTPDALFELAASATGGRVKREFLQSQVEVVTRPRTSMRRIREELTSLREEVA